MNSRFVNLRLFIVLSVLTGLVYPLLITLAGQIFFPFKSGGSLLTFNNKSIGSELIGQNFSDLKYFHSRPSAVDYNASASGAGHYAPSNAKFLQEVKNRIAQTRTKNGISQNQTLPADSVLTSGSGLDPHITVETALLQVPRIAKSRRLSESDLIYLVNLNIEKSQMGFLGESRVNVLKLNMALDRRYCAVGN